MTHRFLVLLFVLGTLVLSMGQPAAAAEFDRGDDGDANDDTTLIGEPPSPTVSAGAIAALQSNSYERIGVALFS